MREIKQMMAVAVLLLLALIASHGTDDDSWSPGGAELRKSIAEKDWMVRSGSFSVAEVSIAVQSDEKDTAALVADADVLRSWRGGAGNGGKVRVVFPTKLDIGTDDNAGSAPVTRKPTAGKRLVFLRPMPTVEDKRGMEIKWLSDARKKGAQWVAMASYESSEKNVFLLDSAIPAASGLEKLGMSLLALGVLLPVMSGMWLVQMFNMKSKREGNAVFAGKVAFWTAAAQWAVFAAYLGVRPSGIPGSPDLLALLPVSAATAFFAFKVLGALSANGIPEGGTGA